MSSVKSLNSSNFDSTIASNVPVLVDFWAPWCGPCKMLAPTLDALSAELPETKGIVCKVNVDEAPEIASKYGVNQIPTIIFFKNSREMGRSGMATKDSLKEKILAM